MVSRCHSSLAMLICGLTLIIRARKAPSAADTRTALILTSPLLLLSTFLSLSGSYLMPSSLISDVISGDVCLSSMASACQQTACCVTSVLATMPCAKCRTYPVLLATFCEEPVTSCCCSKLGCCCRKPSLRCRYCLRSAAVSRPFAGATPDRGMPVSFV